MDLQGRGSLPDDLEVGGALVALDEEAVVLGVEDRHLVVPPGSHDPPPQHGIVLAVGPGLDWWEHAGVQMPIQVGDHVVFPASAGTWIEVDEERLLVCRVTELLGVLETVATDAR